MSDELPLVRLNLGEFGLLALMFIVSAYMLYGSYEYQSLAGFFPRLMAVITLVLTVPLLVRRLSFVPSPVRNVVEGGQGTLTETSGAIDIDEDTEPEEIPDERTSASKKTAFLGALTAGYMILGFLVGLLWATPLFIVAYLRYVDKPWPKTLGIAVVVTVVVYFMMSIFNFTLETGWVFDQLGIEVPVGVVGGTHRLAGHLADVIVHV